MSNWFESCWSVITVVALHIQRCWSAKSFANTVSFFSIDIRIFSNQHCHNFLSLGSPFVSVFLRIIQVFITGDSENSTILQLLGQRNDVIIVKPQLAFIPAESWIL